MTDAQCIALIAVRFFDESTTIGSAIDIAKDILFMAKDADGPQPDVAEIATMAVLLYTHYQNGEHDVTIRMRDCIDEAIRAHRMVFGRVTAPVADDTSVIMEPRKTGKE